MSSTPATSSSVEVVGGGAMTGAGTSGGGGSGGGGSGGGGSGGGAAGGGAAAAGGGSAAGGGAAAGGGSAGDGGSQGNAGGGADDRQGNRGSAFALVATMLGAAGNFGLLVLIQTRYGERAFGVFSAITAMFVVLSIVLRLGSETGATYFIARLRAANQRADLRGLIRSAVMPVVVLSCLVAALGLVFAQPVSNVLAPDASQEYRNMLLVVIGGIPIAAVGETLLGATRGFGSMRPTILSSQLGRQVGQLVTVSVVSLFSADLELLAAAWTLPYLATVLYPGWWLAKHLAPRADDDRQLASTSFGEFWRYSAPQAANSSAQSGLEKLDIILIAPLIGQVETGVYNMVNRLAHVVALGWFAINSAQAPVYAARFAEGKNAETGIQARKVAGWIALAVGPVLWCFIVFPDRVLLTLQSNAELGSGALIVLAVALLMALLAGPSESLLLMSGGSATAFFNNISALAINLGGNLILIPRFGLVGAATAWTISLWYVRTLAAIQIYRRRGVVVLGRATLEAIAITGVAFGLVGTVARTALGNSFLVMVLTGVIGLVVMGVGAHLRRDRLSLDELLESLGIGGSTRPASPASPASPVAEAGAAPATAVPLAPTEASHLGPPAPATVSPSPGPYPRSGEVMGRAPVPLIQFGAGTGELDRPTPDSEAGSTPVDRAQSAGWGPNPPEANGTPANGRWADGTWADGTSADGAWADGTPADGRWAGGARANGSSDTVPEGRPGGDGLSSNGTSAGTDGDIVSNGQGHDANGVDTRPSPDPEDDGPGASGGTPPSYGSIWGAGALLGDGDGAGDGDGEGAGDGDGVVSTKADSHAASAEDRPLPRRRL